MAFTPGVAAWLLKRARGIIAAEAIAGGRSTNQAHRGVAVSRLRDLMKTRAEALEGYTPQALRSLAMSAVRQANAAEEMRNDPARALRIGELPLTPAEAPGGERFIYQAMVRVHVAGVEVDSWVTEYVSDSPQSQSQIDSAIRSSIDTYTTPGRADRPSPYVVPEGAAVDIQVVAAGRSS